VEILVRTKTPMKQKAAFQAFTDELALALHRLGIELEQRVGGVLSQGGREVGHVTAWRRWGHVAFVLSYHEWEQSDTKIEFGFRPLVRGTQVTIECDGLASPFLVGTGEPLGWFADQLVAPLVATLSSPGFGDWLTDRVARRPTGAGARKSYRDPTHHRPNFVAILEELALTPNDKFMEVGCGGGALLNDALKSGCTAAGVDHSPEMVRLARRVNARAIREGRLEVRESDADTLPFGDSAFTRAAMTSVLGFLQDPVKAFKEVARTLAPGGKMVVFSTSEEARGTMAAPEPMASRIHFYSDAELQRMAVEAGFTRAHVERPDLKRFVKGSGVPKRDEHAFSTRIGQLLVAEKGSG
jgi:SAM-dependent methyltransferase